MAASDQRTIDTLADIICRHARLNGLYLAAGQQEKVAAEMYIYIITTAGNTRPVQGAG